MLPILIPEKTKLKPYEKVAIAVGVPMLLILTAAFIWCNARSILEFLFFFAWVCLACAVQFGRISRKWCGGYRFPIIEFSLCGLLILIRIFIWK